MRCTYRGEHNLYNWIRPIWCSLEQGHEGRHIAYWNNEYVAPEMPMNDVLGIGEIGGAGAGEYFNWVDDPEEDW